MTTDLIVPEKNLVPSTECPFSDEITGFDVEEIPLSIAKIHHDRGRFFIDPSNKDYEKLLGWILAAAKSRIRWAEEEAEILCRSLDAQISEEGKDCMTCPHAKWIDGDRPACSTVCNLLVLMQDDADACLFRCARTAYLAAKNYVMALVKQRRPLYSVVTEISLEPRESKFGKMYFVPKFKRLKDITDKNDLLMLRDAFEYFAPKFSALRVEVEIEGEEEESKAESADDTNSDLPF